MHKRVKIGSSITAEILLHSPYMRLLFLAFPLLLLTTGFAGYKSTVSRTVKVQPKVQEFDAKKFKDQVDKEVGDESRLVYFAKVKGVEKPFSIPRRNYIKDNIEKTIGLLYDKSGKKVIYAVEEILGDMGDFTTDYKHYFDSLGHTIIFERWSGFFHSQCVHNDVLHESEVLYFDKNFNQTSRTYTLTRPNGKLVDSIKCDFPYHYEYNKFSTEAEFLKNEKLD